MPRRILAELTFDNPEATADFAAAFSRVLAAGDLLLLSGPTGAGKTHFVRAAIQTLLRQLGRDEIVPSPSYTLVQTFELDRVEIWHADLYRLGDSSELDELGLMDAIDTNICFVEWPDVVEVVWPATALRIDIALGAEDDTRRFVITGEDALWQDRLLSCLKEGDVSHGR